MAFVVVQHLDPRYLSTLPDLNQRIARLPAKEVKDRMKVRPGTIYVIPPKHELTLLHDTLHLLEPVSQTGLRLPIDYFLRTLAEDRHELAIGVILSGMGSDGMMGLRAIKEQGALLWYRTRARPSPRGCPEAPLRQVWPTSSPRLPSCRTRSPPT
jgi:two-component system CheB/CheR fusion protein